MSPFRKSDRPTGPWYVWPSLPGFGRVGPWSTGLSSKALAESVERWLKDIAVSDPAVVRGILEGHYSLREAYQAHQEKRLGALKEKARDPLIVDVIERFRAISTDRRQREGLDMLEVAIPRGARFSWLTEAKHITDLLTDAARTRKVNSVHRSLYHAIKGLLTYQVGKARKLAICADVQFRHEDDTRRVDVTAEQLATLLDACDPEMRDLAAAAALTGIDRKPLLALTPAAFDFARGVVRVPDRKAKGRPRTLELSDAALSIFRRRAAGLGGHDRLWALGEDAVEGRWAAAKRATGLDVRFKDLRHVFAGAWVDEGGTLTELGATLGHKRAATSLRYIDRQKSASAERMDRVAERLGLAREHLRVERGA